MRPDLDQRLERLYAAVGATFERRPDHLGVQVTSQAGAVFIAFRGGYTNVQLENAAMQAVFHVAHLQSHLKRWVKERKGDPQAVDQAIRQSESLKILIDLANADKHGPPRDGGLTRRAPRLTGLTRALRLTGGNTPPELEIPLGGVGRVKSKGDTAAVITGDIVDRDGNRVGELQETLQAGVAAWERFLQSQPHFDNESGP